MDLLTGKLEYDTIANQVYRIPEFRKVILIGAAIL